MTLFPQLRTICVKIDATPGRRASFRIHARKKYPTETLSNQNGPPTLIWRLMPVRDVRTRWNYTHAMIKRGLILRKVRQHIICPLLHYLTYFTGYRQLGIRLR